MLSGILWHGLWFFALSMTALLFAGWVWGDRLLAVRLTQYLLPWVFFGLLAAMVPSVLTRRGWLVLALALPALIIAYHYLPVFLPKKIRPFENHPELKVMSFNVWSENHSLQSVAELIERENPDILLLQEIEPFQMKELQQFLAASTGLEDSPWDFAYAPLIMQATGSRYPVSELATNRRKGKMQAVRVETPAGGITVFNVHPLRGNWQRRHRQMQTLLREDILVTDEPVILGGDFNTTDMSETYALLSRYLDNAHWEAGWGFGFSYPAERHAWQRFLPSWPLVRIDHIFYNSHFAALCAETLDESAGSDHFPVVARLVLTKGPGLTAMTPRTIPPQPAAAAEKRETLQTGFNSFIKQVQTGFSRILSSRSERSCR